MSWRTIQRALVTTLCLCQLDAQPVPKRFPAPGIPVPANVRVQLLEKLRHLQNEIAGIREAGVNNHDTRWLPDIEIFEKAIRSALDHDEFYRTNEFTVADKLLEDGLLRARLFQRGEKPWRDSTGPTVGAYRSRIDGSVQPFGLVVPESYRPGDGKRYRLDIWLHGRDETLTELKFLHERSTKIGEFAPKDAFVLHPYGRYCNAFKFAGEVDVFEALETVKEWYPIDVSRVVLRGFSMGGAGVWHLATHYPDQWVCAAPGAGFAETQRYLRVKPEDVPEYERALWQWYDATDYALNLFDCPTIAYSGELDKQRQAADVMNEALRAEGLPLVHLIGPKTEHKYQPETKRFLNTLVDALAAEGKNREPNEIRFTTRTLMYSKVHWLVVGGLENHWARADVRGRISSNRVELALTNVSAFLLDRNMLKRRGIIDLKVNGTAVPFDLTTGETSNYIKFARKGHSWISGGEIFEPMKKYPGHQGPIDDAFMDSFVFVQPSRKGFHNHTTVWVEEELKRAALEWRAQFRGDAQIIGAEEVLKFPNSHLVLWGDPESNDVIKEILPQLPLKWTKEKIEFGGKTYDAGTHIPLMIFPNPLNPTRYVVLNSGFTFRGFGSNANQTAKLPDYALLDISREDPFAAGVVTAGFFDEDWKLSGPAK